MSPPWFTGLLQRDAQGIRAPYDSVHTEVSLYVKRLAAAANADGTEPMSLNTSWAQWQADGRAFWQQMDALVETLDGLDRT